MASASAIFVLSPATSSTTLTGAVTSRFCLCGTNELWRSQHASAIDTPDGYFSGF
jgi:hypothetical protein